MTEDDSFIFDARYPPDTSLPVSDEYGEDVAGYYGRSAHDLAIVQSANPRCVWTVIEGDDGLYAVSGFHTVNWLNYYISSEPRPDVADDFEEYMLVANPTGDDDEEQDYV